MFAIQLFGGAEIHGHAMLHHFVLLENLFQDLERPPAINHEIFRDNFEPIARRFFRQDVVIVRDAQPDPDTVRREAIEPIRRHSASSSPAGESRPRQAGPLRRKKDGSLNGKNYCFSSGILEPSVAQPPLPLQEFLPLQPLSLLLQPPLPLQEFWPLQACFSFTFLSAFLSLSVLPFALARRFD